MADRVEVVIDFSEYPVGALVVLRSFERNGKKLRRTSGAQRTR